MTSPLELLWLCKHQSKLTRKFILLLIGTLSSESEWASPFEGKPVSWPGMDAFEETLQSGVFALITKSGCRSLNGKAHLNVDSGKLATRKPGVFGQFSFPKADVESKLGIDKSLLHLL